MRNEMLYSSTLLEKKRERGRMRSEKMRNEIDACVCVR